jgi:hypothetical protein
MYRPGLYRADDPDLMAARDGAFEVLESSAAELAAQWQIDDVAGLVLAGWSMCHGLATLLLAGNLEDRVPTDLAEISAQLGRGISGLGRVIDRRASGASD